MAIPWTGATRATAAPGASSGWYPVAHSAEVSTTPVQVGAGGQAYVVVRLTPDGEVTAVSARCPHRLVPIVAATVVDGRLRCPYHGWRFNAEGRCVEIPSLGPDGTPPPPADLTVPWAVEERDGWVWLAPERTATLRPPRIGGARAGARPGAGARSRAAVRPRARQPRPVAGTRLAPRRADPGAGGRRLRAGATA